jgi:hypothetical protein
VQSRVFHIWDFPDHTRVWLRNQEQFLRKCATEFSSLKGLSERLGLKSHTISSWIKYKIFIPILVLDNICAILGLDHNQIEKRIISYKGPNSSEPIRNPILPLKESPEIFEIITHLICDGCVNKNGIPMYVNSNKHLRKNLVKLLQIFGEIEIKEYVSESGCHQFHFQKIIIDFIKKHYNVKFYSESGYLPEEVFYLPKEFKIGAIRAAIDDEGSIRDGRIVISVKNQKLAKQIRKLFQDIFGPRGVGKITQQRTEFYAFGTRTSILKDFTTKVSLIHPKKKQELKWSLKKKANKDRFKSEYRRRQILNFLKTKSFLTTELSNHLLINNSHIGVYLRRLKKEFLITSLREGYGLRWYITPIGAKHIKDLGG